MHELPLPETVWTIGHSTRPLDDFVGLLQGRQVEAIVDVRRFPGSRRHPHFNREALERSLPGVGIHYLWLPQLGGRRKPLPDSSNTAWRNLSFRGYADHLDSAEFAEGFEAMLDVARQRRSALMCSEVLWWRCHRALVSDVLRVRGVQVVHIQDARHDISHPYSGPARVVDGRLTYAAPAEPGLFD